MTSYKTILSTSTGTFKDRGSKFIAKVFHVSDEASVKSSLASARKEFYDARHHCYAFSLGWKDVYHRSNDDGEPSNSAGPPIYGQIQAFDVTNVLIVVVRYFGGTKLGVGGLINAYRSAAKEALENANIVEIEIKNLYSLRYAYDQTAVVRRLLDRYKCDIVKEEFNETCQVEFKVPLRFEAPLVQDLGLEKLTYKSLQ